MSAVAADGESKGSTYDGNRDTGELHGSRLRKHEPGWRGRRDVPATRLLVRLDAESAVRLAVGELESVGFVPAARDLGDELRSGGTGWTGEAPEIGANRASVLTGLVEDTRSRLQWRACLPTTRPS